MNESLTITEVALPFTYTFASFSADRKGARSIEKSREFSNNHGKVGMHVYTITVMTTLPRGIVGFILPLRPPGNPQRMTLSSRAMIGSVS